MYLCNMYNIFFRDNTTKSLLNIDILDNLWLPEFFIYDLKYFEKKKTIKSQDSLRVFKTKGTHGSDLVVQIKYLLDTFDKTTPIYTFIILCLFHKSILTNFHLH